MLIKENEVKVGDLEPGDVFQYAHTLSVVASKCNILMKYPDSVNCVDLHNGVLCHFHIGDTLVRKIEGSYDC